MSPVRPNTHFPRSWLSSLLIGVVLVAWFMAPMIAAAPLSGARIEIEKYTNGEDANVAPGPRIPAGSIVSWTYRVTNTGEVPLTSINVKDDREGLVCTRSSLLPGESMSCLKYGIAQPGPYQNEGCVMGSTESTQGGSSGPFILISATDQLASSITDCETDYHIGIDTTPPVPDDRYAEDDCLGQFHDVNEKNFGFYCPEYMCNLDDEKCEGTTYYICVGWFWVVWERNSSLCPGEECHPGDEKCEGEDYYQCLGGYWVLRDQSSASCPGKECRADDVKCEGTEYFECIGGYWVLKEENAASCPGEECRADEVKCEGEDYYQCLGGYWVFLEQDSPFCPGEECHPGDEKCEGTEYYECIGGYWVFGGSGAGFCPGEECRADEVKCEGEDYYQCAGGYWLLIQANSSLCPGEECNPGEKKCEGTEYYECLGGYWVLMEENAASCPGEECRADEEKCEGTEYYACIGGYWVFLDAESAFCPGEECNPGEKKCEGTEYYECIGGYWVLAETGSAACPGKECRLDDVKCEGMEYYQCSGGYWVFLEQDSPFCPGEECNPGEEKCEGTEYYECLGGYWVFGGSHSPICPGQTCTIGDEMCEGTDYYTCLGGFWVRQQENAPICILPPGCSSGENYCLIDDLYKCNEGVWVLEQQNVPACHFPPHCTESEHYCLIDDLYECQGGAWQQAEVNSPFCTLPCRHGDSTCLEDDYYECRSGSWRLIERESGFCPIPCQDRMTYCLGYTLYLCDDGAWEVEHTRSRLCGYHTPSSTGTRSGGSSFIRQGTGRECDFYQNGTLQTSLNGEVRQNVTICALDGIGKIIVSEGTVALTGGGSPLTYASIVPLAAPPQSGTEFETEGPIYGLLPYGSTIIPSIQLSMAFTPERWSELEGRDLVLRQWDIETGRWEEIPLLADGDQRVITARISGLGIVGLFNRGSVLPAHEPVAEPNPVPQSEPAFNVIPSLILALLALLSVLTALWWNQRSRQEVPGSGPSLPGGGFILPPMTKVGRDAAYSSMINILNDVEGQVKDLEVAVNRRSPLLTQQNATAIVARFFYTVQIAEERMKNPDIRKHLTAGQIRQLNSQLQAAVWRVSILSRRSEPLLNAVQARYGEVKV